MTDTTGLAAGKKRFPMSLTDATGRTKYGTANRKTIKMGVAASEGKGKPGGSISSVGGRKAKKALAPKSKSGSKISKKK